MGKIPREKEVVSEVETSGRSVQPPRAVSLAMFCTVMYGGLEADDGGRQGDRVQDPCKFQGLC